MAVADLNLSGCADRAERVQHGCLPLEGLRLDTLDLPALLAPRTRLAAHTPFTWLPAVSEKHNCFQ